MPRWNYRCKDFIRKLSTRGGNGEGPEGGRATDHNVATERGRDIERSRGSTQDSPVLSERSGSALSREELLWQPLPPSMVAGRRPRGRVSLARTHSIHLRSAGTFSCHYPWGQQEYLGAKGTMLRTDLSECLYVGCWQPRALSLPCSLPDPGPFPECQLSSLPS